MTMNFSDDGAVFRPRGLDAPTERQIHPEVRDDLLAQPVRPVLCGGDRLQVQGLRLQEQIDRDDRNAPSCLYTLRRPVMCEVLSTRIWGVPPAGGPLL